MRIYSWSNLVPDEMSEIDITRVWFIPDDELSKVGKHTATFLQSEAFSLCATWQRVS
jgi:hypothetical protein